MNYLNYENKSHVNMSGKSLPLKVEKAIPMSFKKFSLKQDASRAKPDDTAKATPIAARPADQSEKKPAEAAPAPKL